MPAPHRSVIFNYMLFTVHDGLNGYGDAPLVVHYSDTRCHFNVRSEADMSQLHLLPGTNNYKVENRKSKM